ncbi:MAG: glycoside hydrolase family 9 protein [Chitinispirillales bacterium]|jgi:hypothetical protein|nr:glycoside hydrolase family 9 protein [Chitinispirillales bacterium]
MVPHKYAVPCIAAVAAVCFAYGQEFTDYIVIDQFGYREPAKKTAVIRVPQKGAGSPSSYAPGAVFEVINEADGEAVHAGAPVSFRGGQTDSASGDRIWHFDFSAVTAPGRYHILDKANNLRSFAFDIRNDVYNRVFKAAMKMLYYQRAGTNKPARYAGAEWEDGLNFEQDKRTRYFFAKNDASTERDLSGGWFDAGDYNKYTKWLADYVSNMILMYGERPDVFGGDYGIPESGNGVPDFIDEAKWGLAWLIKMQNDDGSVLSVQGLQDGSPPSSVTEPSYYGPPNATATYGAAAAYAVASQFFGGRGEAEFAERLRGAAVKAWQWGEAHPDSIFHNNCGDSWNKDKCPGYDSRKLAAGDQELSDDWDRVENRMNAALAMYELTGEQAYLTVFEQNWTELPLHKWGSCMQQYRFSQHILLMRYLAADYGSASVKSAIISDFTNAMAKPVGGCNHFGNGYLNDGYRSYIFNYQWGSNKIKADQGLTYYKWNIVDPGKDYKDVAEDYLHYIHGVNPFNMVYLTNMGGYGASKSLTSIYHTWFSEGSQRWGVANGTNPGPAPGYMPGGPNKEFGLDGCCPSGCGDPSNNARCGLVPIPDKNTEPPAKMYKDMNNSWPLNSWEITEPMNAYQLSYIWLLSKFVTPESQTSISPRNTVMSGKKGGVIYKRIRGGIELRVKDNAEVRVFGLNGALISRRTLIGGIHRISLTTLPNGIYIVRMAVDGEKAFLRIPAVGH